MLIFLSFLSGGAATALLLNLPQDTINILIGVCAGILVFLAYVYLRLRAAYRPQPKRRAVRRPVRNRRIVTSVQGFQPVGVYA